MNGNHRFQGLWRAISADWPRYVAYYASIIALLLLIGVSIEQGWFSFIPISLALLLILSYYLATSLWAAHQLYDPGGINPHHVLFEMGQLRETDRFVYLDLGYRRRAISLSRRLTTGQIVVIDVYNPQWTPDRALTRMRRQLRHPPTDPRLEWLDGDITLLPLPDNSVKTVMLDQVTSAFMQRGDQLQLLREVRRILTRDGRLLLAEPTRTQTNWLLFGLSASRLQSAQSWETLLQTAGFIVRRHQSLQGLVDCFRADKPTPSEAQQLTLKLAFNE